MIFLWRCQHCDKWSQAKKRPSYHLRNQKLYEEGDEYGIETVRCGPFRQYQVLEAEPEQAPLKDFGKIEYEFIYEDHGGPF